MLRGVASIARVAKVAPRMAAKAPVVAAPIRSMASFQKVNVADFGIKAKSLLQTMNKDQMFLASSIALGTCLPASILFAPTFLATPFDTVVALAMPFHLATGVNHIVEDYTPVDYKHMATIFVKVLAFLVAYGLLKVSICGPGIGMSIKSLWRDPPKGAKKADH